MARAPVPTVAYFRRRAVKPDAFESIPDEDVLDCLEDVTDYAATFTGKHTAREITAWDRSFQRAIIALAAAELMAHQGYNKSQGADVLIEQRADKADRWLDKVASGEVEPFVDDGANYDADGPRGGSSEKSDAWAEYATECGCT